MALVNLPGADRLAGELAARDCDVGRAGRSGSNSHSIRVLALDGV
jgi:hypothetical protein